MNFNFFKSKRYFTKYIKVDELLKHDSIIFTVAFGFVRLIENNPNDDYWDAIRLSNGRRVTINKYTSDKPTYKLFLCERDSYYGEAPEGQYIDQKLHNGGVNTITATRIIGEISQHATWIKEKMKFDEEEVLGINFPGQHGRSRVVDLKRRIYKDGYPKIFVKGPCGHYH